VEILYDYIVVSEMKKGQSLNSPQIISSADLCGSSNYSKENEIKSSTLKTEVAKVFMTTEIAHELVDPNPKDYER
jgi:hypothetical protein